VTRLEPASFEVERFELADNARLELRGRWFGVRGRRFMRPTLTAVADGREQRILAVLDHKPWNAEDGESWLAVFPCSTDPAALVQSELTVAPDVTVPLPPPSTPAAGRRPRGGASPRSSPRPAGSKVEGGSPDRGAQGEPGDSAHQLRLEHDAALRSRDEAVLELQAVKRECEQLRGEGRHALDAREVAIAERHESIEAEVRLRIEDLRAEAERERAGARLAAQTARERDEARAARNEAADERDEARAERDAAQRARNRMLAERDTARTSVEEVTRQWELTAGLGTRRTLERDVLAVERDRLARERDAALAKGDRIARERDAALEGRDSISRERDGALEERDRLARERDAALQARESEIDRPTPVLTERDRLGRPEAPAVDAEHAPLMPRVRRAGRRGMAIGTGPSPSAPGVPSKRQHDATRVWRTRLFAVSALLVAVVILGVLLLAE
jgi:hypothetical protein